MKTIYGVYGTDGSICNVPDGILSLANDSKESSQSNTRLFNTPEPKCFLELCSWRRQGTTFRKPITAKYLIERFDFNPMKKHFENSIMVDREIALRYLINTKERQLGDNYIDIINPEEVEHIKQLSPTNFEGLQKSAYKKNRYNVSASFSKKYPSTKDLVIYLIETMKLELEFVAALISYGKDDPLTGTTPELRKKFHKSDARCDRTYRENFKKLCKEGKKYEIIVI